MLSYRVYCLNAEGRIATGDYIEARDDAEAIELVRAKRAETNCELWCGTRKIALIPAGGGAAILYAGQQFPWIEPQLQSTSS